MKNTLAVIAVTSLISACGGGGGSGGSVSAGLPPTPVALAAYAGVWEAACNFHQRETATFTLDASSALSISTKTEYFSATGCTGNILGTRTLSANFSAVYAGTVDASVQLAAGAATTAIKVDTVTSSAPSFSAQVTGPGVVRTTTNGKAQWCIDFGGGSSTCINDDGVQPAKTSGGGLYLIGNKLFSLEVSGTSFVVGGIYTKK
jgi:hypothetical protein